MSDDVELMKSLELERKQIEDGRKVKEFLAEPAIADALLRIEKKYVNEFHAADSDDKRRTVWAKTKVLTDFVREMEAMMGSAQLAAHARNTRTAHEDRVAASRTPRK